MVKLKSLCLGMTLLMLITACQQPFGAQVAVPTLVEFPTETETSTPTETPNVTDTATPSDTPTATATFTPSTTPTATQTASPTWTRPPSSTPTRTQTFTPSPSPTLEASLTPIPTRTSSAPVIEVFNSNTVNTNNGSPVTLRWVVRADSARLETLDSAGNVLQTIDVELIGSLQTNTPTTGNVVTYRLTAIRGSEEVRSIITVDMTQSCITPWFFTNAPSSAGCPTSPALAVQVFYQQFQTGFMFRTTANGAARVCGVQFDRNLYSCYAAQTFAGVPPATPPAGLNAPNALVEYSFYNDLATGGFWYNIIGWGTDTGSTLNVQQQTGSDGRTFYQLPGGIYPFDTNLTSIGSPTIRVNSP